MRGIEVSRLVWWLKVKEGKGAAKIAEILAHVRGEDIPELDMLADGEFRLREAEETLGLNPGTLIKVAR